MNKAATNTTMLHCGHCGCGIDLDGQYCAGCGQPLWHLCVCGTRALLTQPFCDSCGTNLNEKFQARRAHIENFVVRCRGLRQDGKYLEAMQVAQGACNPPDYRFADLADEAQRHIAEMSAEIAQWESEIAELQPRINRYLDQGRFGEIVKILAPIPVGALPVELAEVLKSCRERSETVSRQRVELENALHEKKYDVALSQLTQLLESQPNDAKYKSLAAQLTGKVLQQAAECRKQLQFAKAIDLLHSVPWHCQDTKYMNLLTACEETVLLRQILAKSIYLEPTVIAVFDRLERMTGADPIIEKLRVRLQTLRRQPSKNALWPQWAKPGNNVLGATVTPIGIPSEKFGALPKCVLEKGSQFFVALGLALQATRNLMPMGDLLQDSRSKGVMGLLASASSKARKTGWGIDIGDSSIKVIKLRCPSDTSPPQIEYARLIELDSKAGPVRAAPKEAIVAGISQLLTEAQLGGERVFVNYPASELISRYIALPPHAPLNKMRDFLMQDAQAHIPIDLKLLLTSFHISNYSKQDSSSPSAVLVAARRHDLELRKAILESAGLKINGMLPEPFALWNAMQTVALNKRLPHDAQPTSREDQDRYAADMLVDIGRNRSNIVIAHAQGMWHRTIDWGTESLNTAIAKKTQLTQSEADSIRRGPLRAKQLQPLMEAMQAACQVPKREFERSDFVARETIGSTRLRRVVLVGGGAYQPFLSSWLNGADFLQALGNSRPSPAPAPAPAPVDSSAAVAS